MISRIPLFIFIAVVMTGCVSPMSVSLKDVKEEFLSQAVFSDPNAQLNEEQKALRSGYILAAIGLYGVHAVKSYGGEEQEDDARIILARLIDTKKQLSARVTGQTGVPNFLYADYALDVMRFVKVAAEPTKRYYRERMMSLFLGFDGIAMAKTTFAAFKGLTETAWYEGAIRRDATLQYQTIVNGAVDQSHWDSVNELLSIACHRLSLLAGRTSSTECTDDNIKIMI